MANETYSHRFVAWMIAWRWPLLAVATLLTAASIVPSQNLAFDRAIENMFATSDPLLAPYAKLKRTFGGNEIVMATYVDGDLFTPAGMQRLAGLSAALKAVPGVADVLTIHSLMGDEIADQTNPLAERFRDLFDGYTHRINSDSGITACAAVCMLIPEADTKVPRAETIAQLRTIIDKQPEGSLAGEPVMVVDGFRYLEEDGRRLGVTSTILLTITIALCFRSLRWVIAPMLVVQCALLWTRALLVVGGFRLSMVSSMLTAIVTVVGVATVIHIVVQYRETRAANHLPHKALLISGALIAVSVFWSCVTDAAGFGSLLVSSVGPVQDFGIMMSLGSLLVLVAVVLIIPGVALAFPQYDLDPKRAWGEGFVEAELQRLLRWVENRPKSLMAIITIVSAIASAGGWRLTVESDFTKNFRESSPVARSYAFVETNLGGAGVWDVLVPAPDRLTWPYLAAILTLEKRLRTEVPDLTKVLSLADAVKASAPADLDKVRIRIMQGAMLNASLTLMRTRIPEFYDALYGVDPTTVATRETTGADKELPTDEKSPAQHYLRIMLRAPERQTAEAKLAMIGEVERISYEEFAKIRQQFPDAVPAQSTTETEVTGYFVLLTNLIDSILGDQWKAFFVATAAIGVMMLCAFRSLKLSLVALVPNVVPITVVMGLMGWLDLKINMGAAMIAAVSMGLSIDSSVHYISGFIDARKTGLSVSAALVEVQRSVGLAMFFSTLALIIGFGALCTSEFIPTIYFGALVCLTMIGGLAGNLLLLPLLLKLVVRD